MLSTSTADTSLDSIEMQPGGVAPIISYNVPEPTTYSGRNFIDLQFPASYFAVSPLTAADIARALDISGPDQKALMARAVPSLGVDPVEADLMARQGKRLQIYRSMSGELATTWVEANVAPEPHAKPDVRMTAIPIPDDGGSTEPDPDIGVTINSPGDNSTVSGPATGVDVTIQGTVWSNRTIAEVSVRVGSGSFIPVYLDGTNWSYSTTLTTPGWTTITARGRTDANLISDHVISVNVALAPPPDTVPPAVGITSPANGAALSGPDTGVAVTVTGIAMDSSGIQTVDVGVDGGAFAPAIPQAPNDWSTWSQTLTLAAGNHSITARATDKAGNPSQQTVSVSVTVAPPADTTGPSVTITSPKVDDIVQGPYSGATITVEGTSSDASGIRNVALRLDQSVVLVDARPKDGVNWTTWTGTLVVRDPGIRIVTARATDNAGNTNEASVSVNVQLYPEMANRLNRIVLVESYRLSSYLGNYGAGRTLKTFSLFPGEKTKISLKTYTRSEEQAKNASSILDSFTHESAVDLENAIQDEQSNKKNYDETLNYKVGGETKLGWGWGSAGVHGEISGGTNAAREEFAKNITNAVQKHVSKASAKREVQINTSYEVKTETGEETSIEREIANINVGKTLNFVFRQMNQEFITILHLVDVRVGYVKVIPGVDENGKPKNDYIYREVTLPELDSLLADAIVEDKRPEVRNAILRQLTNVFDYKDRHHVLVEEEPFKDASGKIIPASSYLRMRKNYTSTYVDKASGTQIKIPGVILAANTHILRTEGVMVEALLGHGDGLDAYSHGLQTEAVRAQALENSARELEQATARLALQIVQNYDTGMAQLYQQLFLPGSAGAAPTAALTGTYGSAMAQASSATGSSTQPDDVSETATISR